MECFHDYNNEESEHECLEPKPQRQAQHYEDDSEDDDELHMESAKDYVGRISKALDFVKETERRESLPIKPKNLHKSSSRQASADSQTSIETVFRMSTTSISTINSRYPSLKHTDSGSTQETVDISDDELSLASEEEETPEETVLQPVSVLRRKEKLGTITAPRGGAVTFCPTTVFPDPNEVPKKRRRVKRLRPKQKPPELQIFVPACEELPLELRRLERRAQQNQYHPYLSNDHRSLSSDMLLPSESFYVFR